MTEAEAISKLKEIKFYSDTEVAHSEADSVLCEFLEAQGFVEVVSEFQQIHKWYA